MSLSQKVAFNTLTQMGGKIAASFFTFLTTMLLVAYLWHIVYGGYTYVISLLVLFGALGDWGTNIISVREAVRLKEKQGQAFANIFFLKIAMAIPAMVLLVIFALFAPFQTNQPVVFRQAVVIASFFLILTALRAASRVVFQVKLQFQKAAIADVFTSVLMFIASWWVIQTGYGLIALIGVYLLAVGVGAAMMVWFVLGMVKFAFRFDQVFIVKLLKESLPMGAILLMFTMDNRIDTVMLGAFQGSGDVGIYGLASRVYDVLILGAAFLMNALLPILSDYRDLKQSKIRLQKIYQKTFDVLVLLAIGVGILLWLLAPLIVQILAGERFGEFQDAVRVLRWLSPALFLTYFNHLTGYTIVALGKQRSYFFIALSSLIFNFLANAVLISRFSYFGAVWVTILTEGLVLMATTVFVHKLLGFFPSLFSFPRTALELIKQKGRL